MILDIETASWELAPPDLWSREIKQQGLSAVFYTKQFIQFIWDKLLVSQI